MVKIHTAPPNYSEIKALIEAAPPLETCDLSDAGVCQWLGRVSWVIEAAGDVSDAVAIKVAADNLSSVLRRENARTIMMVLYRALARAEPMVKTGGGFVPHGDLFEAFVQIATIFQSAASDLLIVDPYVSDQVLRDYGKSAAEGTTLRLLGAKNKHTETLAPAARAWNQTSPQRRPLEVRLVERGVVHDRIIVVDRTTVWIVTQSLKDLAANAPATVTRFADDLAPPKREAYEAIWSSAAPI
jgi:hypothetical protein